MNTDRPQVDSPNPWLATGRDALVRAAVTSWQRYLVDFGGRNTLLWFQDLPSGTLDLTRAHPAGIAKLFSSGSVHLGDLIREPAALADAQQRARIIRNKTRELVEERGVSTCFLAIGIASWDQSGAPRPPAAPVLLQRCEIFVPAGQYDVLALRLGDEVEFNAVLAKYIDVEYGIALDFDQINEFTSITRSFDVAKLFGAVQRACAGVSGFVIDRRYVVSSFIYTKLPMLRDLTDQLNQLSTHHVIAALAGDQEAQAHVAADALPFVGIDPAAEHLVLDADASQEGIVEAVRAGAHLIIKGPPGTGKSQTIANLIATIAADGRRVLFVAEKRAAIDAVVKRLDQVDLRDLVYDGQIDHHSIAGEFVNLMDQVIITNSSPKTDQTELISVREMLTAHWRAMHEHRPPWGVSVDEAQTRVTELDALHPAPRSRAWIEPSDLEVISEVSRQKLYRDLVEVARLGAWRTNDHPDPWYGARVVGVQQAVRTRDLVARLSSGDFVVHRAKLDALCDKVGIPPTRTMIESANQLKLMSEVHKTLESFRPEIFAALLDDLVMATGTSDFRKAYSVTLGVMERRRLDKQARNLLRPGQPPTDLHGVLVLAATQRARWREIAGKGSQPSAPVEVASLTVAHERLCESLQWLGARLSGTADGGELLGADFDELADRLDTLTATNDRLALVPTVIGKLDQLRANGLGALLDDLAARKVSVDQVEAEFEFVWWRAFLAWVAETDPAYGDVDGTELREVAAAYAAADAAHVRSGAARVRASCADQVRRVVRDLPEQERFLREQARTRKSLPMRELLPVAPELLTALKPCWAMSPLVVASIMPPGLWFDVVVFDEASQIPLAEAISVISRAGQVVVAGDARQLSATSFFRAAADDLDETDVAGGESVLDALSPLLPGRELSWHYRSLDERLIVFANAHIYHDRLITFPGVGGDAIVRLDVVDGQSVDGESTDIEVARVVQVVFEQARQHPQESVGVITLGQRHADRIDAAVRTAVTDAPNLRWLLDDQQPEPFFIKNLERVQGDERDAIVLAIGYNHTSQGELLHRFGLVSAEGGERRLNVAITRARRRMTVVSSFSGDELHLERLRSRGGLMLRDFLLYAASGGAARRAGTINESVAGRQQAPQLAAGVIRGPDGKRRRVASSGSVLDRPLLPETAPMVPSPLVLDLVRRLRAEALVVHPGWGMSSHRLDLAVEDPHKPGSLLVAIETDGPVYGSIVATRDRERLRVEQLCRLGWVHERVWTRDLFRDPAREVARLVRVVYDASMARQDAEPNGYY